MESFWSRLLNSQFFFSKPKSSATPRVFKFLNLFWKHYSLTLLYLQASIITSGDFFPSSTKILLYFSMQMELSMAVSQFSFFCISGIFKITLEGHLNFLSWFWTLTVLQELNAG